MRRQRGAASLPASVGVLHVKPSGRIGCQAAGWRGVDSALVGAVMLGAATGLRSQAGIAAVLLGSDTAGLPTVLTSHRARAAVAAAALGELVVDKLPQAMSRLKPGPLAARFLLGELAAGQFARTRRRPVLPSAIVGGLTAMASAKIGHDTRASLAKRLPDPVVAVLEDCLSAALAFGAAGTFGIADRP